MPLKTFTALVATVLLIGACATPVSASDPVPAGPGWHLAIHGGAGVILRESLSAEQEAEYVAALNMAMEAGPLYCARVVAPSMRASRRLANGKQPFVQCRLWRCLRGQWHA